VTSDEVDLNSDLGEGLGIWTLGDDAALLAIVTSANVACGFHGGDPGIMRRTCWSPWTGRSPVPSRSPRRCGPGRRPTPPTRAAAS
jgi:hypothetical protein